MEDAEKWTLFRSILQNQVDEARKIRTEYSGLKYESEADDKALDDLEKTIDSFAENASSRITQLDEVSQSLIQIVSILNNSNVSQAYHARFKGIIYGRDYLLTWK